MIMKVIQQGLEGLVLKDTKVVQKQERIKFTLEPSQELSGKESSLIPTSKKKLPDVSTECFRHLIWVKDGDRSIQLSHRQIFFFPILGELSFPFVLNFFDLYLVMKIFPQPHHVYNG